MVIVRKYGNATLRSLFLSGWIVAFFIIVFSLFSCDTEPPVVPPGPDVVGFKATGDVNVDYISKKGFISILSGSVKMFQFSSDATINKEHFAFIISVFRKSETDTTRNFIICDPQFTSGKENYAMVSLITKYLDKQNQKVIYAQDGMVSFSKMSIGGAETTIKGVFYFNASKVIGSDTIRVTVTDGWFDYTRSF